jgi:hypothetical protein
MSPSFAFQSASSPESLMDELEKFIEFWLGPRRPEYGEPESSLEKFPLPYPLRRLYAFAGRWPPVHEYYLDEPNVFSVQDSLRSFTSLKRWEDGKIDFLVENQGCWTCATLPDGEDPPVWAEGDLGDVGAGNGVNDGTVKRRLVSESLSRFLVTFCLQELLFGSKLCISDDALTNYLESSKESAALLWSNGPYVYSEEEDNYFLLNDAVLVRQMADGAIFGANSNEGIRLLTSNQSEINEVMLITPWSWCLVIKRDGSGNVWSGSNREVSATVPPRTFNFPDLRDRFLSLSTDEINLESTRVFLHRSGQHSTQGKFVRDSGYVRSLFRQALDNLESAGDREMTLIRFIESYPQSD